MRNMGESYGKRNKNDREDQNMGVGGPSKTKMPLEFSGYTRQNSTLMAQSKNTRN